MPRCGTAYGRGGSYINAPLDPECPDNPNHGFWDDPITQECGCADEIIENLERKHIKECKRCQEYGAANIEVQVP